MFIHGFKKRKKKNKKIKKRENDSKTQENSLIPLAIFGSVNSSHFLINGINRFIFCGMLVSKLKMIKNY